MNVIPMVRGSLYPSKFHEDAMEGRPGDRPFLHDRHFSAASSFLIGVLRGGRIALSEPTRILQNVPLVSADFCRTSF
jgi:hypothetical protein